MKNNKQFENTGISLYYGNIKKRLPRETITGFPLSGLLLPDIDLFRVVQKKYDELLVKIGIKRVIRRSFLTTPYKNQVLNKYLFRIWNRLSILAKEGNEKAFQGLCKIILSRSLVMRTLFIWRVEPRFYRTVTLFKMFTTLCSLQDILEKESTRFKFTRLFIPKKDGTLRPLAIPKLEWRILNNWLNVFSNVWLWNRNVSLVPQQFGVLKGSGVGQAWKHIILNHINKKFIFEFDLLKFFDTVPWHSIDKGLKSLGIPKDLIKKNLDLIKWGQAWLATSRIKEWLEFQDKILRNIQLEKINMGLNRKKYWREDIHEQDDALHLARRQSENNLGMLESFAQGKLWFEDTIKATLVKGPDGKMRLSRPKIIPEELSYQEIWKKWYDKVKGYSPRMKQVLTLYNYRNILYECFARPWVPKNSGLSPSAQRFNRLRNGLKIIYQVERGVPQGMGISPLAACASLIPIYKKYKDRLVMYMDDGILFSDNEIDIMEFCQDLRKIGLYISVDKSEWVKQNDVWNKNLKFLGLTYDYNLDELVNSDDSSKKLPNLKELNPEEIIEFIASQKMKNPYSRKLHSNPDSLLKRIRSKSNPELWAMTDRLDFGLSLLYKKDTVNKNLEVRRNSLLDLYKDRIKINPNISSIFTEQLLTMVKASKLKDNRQFIKTKLQLFERIASWNTQQRMLS